MLGTVFLDQADALVPHAHYLLSGRRRVDAARPGESLPIRKAPGRLSRAVHPRDHAPQHAGGLAVGVGFGAGDLTGDITLMLAIGVQNIPEGLAVSVATMNAGLDRRTYAAFAGVRAGVVELPLAVLGASAVTVVQPILPSAMGFAAGAMIFVISDEIVQETHVHGHERVATLGTMAGVLVMLYLDVTLG